MSCTRGRVAPTDVTKARLFADSGGYCQKPDCLAELFVDFDDRAIHLAEIAHIIAAGDRGPRANAEVSAQDRADYDNLVLLCPKCHTIIDKAEDKFPEELVRQWKAQHRQRIAEQFGLRRYGSRKEARGTILPILTANRTIFEQYGPLTEERFDLESTLPREWSRKIRGQIIPNNRKILAICDANRPLLSEEEIAIVELFRQHVDDFEAKHLGGADANGRQFPPGMAHIFV